MARTFPDKPVGSVAPEVGRVFRVLKRLPDDWHVWHHVMPWEQGIPDFLVLDAQNRALLLKVSRATPQQARQAPQLQMFGLEAGKDAETTAPGEADEQILEAFLAQVRREGVSHKAVAGAVIFPNLARKDVRVIQQVEVEPKYPWLGKEWLDGKGTGSWTDLFTRISLDSGELRILRAQFTPEIVVPASFVPRVRHRNIEAGLDEYLLDYNQEYVLKTDLDLSTEGERLSRDFRIQVVKGIAGSGKTLVLLYRLRLLRELFPDKHFLVLTHNRPLIRDMRARFRLLTSSTSKRAKQVGWHTFMGWCRRNWPKQEPYNPLPTWKRDTLIRAVWADHLADSNMTQGMFTSELEWVKDNVITTREEYLEASRRGRGFRLTQGQREQMFTAVQSYQRRLISSGAIDWWDVPRRMWHWIEQGEVKPAQYDVILVDEAQFFAPIWFDIVRCLVLPEAGYLFLAADPTQGFLHRGESWKSIAGLEVRGHSHQLRRSYRTTQAILSCALTFYRQRVPEDTDDLLLPDWTGMQEGKPPLLLRFGSPQDERARIVNEVTQAVEQGVPLRHILVLLASARGEDALREALNQRLGEGTARDPKDVLPGDFIRVTTINAGTGLEGPVVVVAGIHEMFEREGSLRFSEDERAELVRKNTRKLYMAFTRAGQRLILTYVGDLPTSLKDLVRRGLLVVE
ncbi:MAG: DEAD/DEAH box helicase family protein [Chloroflexota bacterium]|nr:DEAD/DEAH box helicase family protein [Chloroflexota bacterium]